MDQELLPLSEAKTHLHELVRDAERRDVILVRHGRPIGVLLGFRRYRDLLGAGPTARPELPLDAAGRERLDRICEARRVRRLVLFGSAARGEASPGSDLDVLVEFRPLSPPQRADALFGLHDDLERLFGRRVDLLEADAIDNPYLIRSIERAQTVLYEAA